jgi:DNA-binding NarL/FixJ family response regulator
MRWTTDLELDDLGELLPLDRVYHAHSSAGVAGARATSVAIADGEALVRAGFNALLSGQEDLAVVGEAGDGDEAVALAGRARPDVMLMDLALPGLGGLEATRRILADPELADVQVLILTTVEPDHDLFGALRAGASGFLVKDTRPAELVRTVRVVASGEAREVMALVAAGMSNREIAERLVVSLATARTHVSRALRKADARDRAQLVALAYETGLVQPHRNAALQV